MLHKNKSLQFLSQIALATFLLNTIAPTIQYSFADSTQYYVDATGGSDLNDGLSPATAWQTLSKVNGATLLQGDTVSLLCSESWSETLSLNALPGSLGLPITINSYGSCGGNTPTIEGIDISGSTYVTVDGIDLSNTIPGSLILINTSNSITVQNSTLTDSNATCTTVSASSGILIDSNTITNCLDAMSISGSEVTISNNTISSILNNALDVNSYDPVSVTDNTFTNIAESAILFGSDTDILRNSISTVCTTGTTECAAIRNDVNISGAVTTVISDNSIKDIGTGISALGDAGILADGMSNLIISKNGVINAQYAVRIIDTSNSSISENMLLSSRINTLSVIQNNTGATTGNSFTGNTFIQRAPDYPYIELRDEVAGDGVVSGFIAFDANNILPNYKPNTSYIRTVKFGGETQEYGKSDLTTLDANITKFEYFGYKPYVNTGSYATANLLTNGDFTSDVANWTPSSLSGGIPSLGHNPVGSYVGGSATITPAGGSADRIWVTNDAILSVTAGQVYHVTGYAKSSSGNINLRAFLHSSSDKTSIYSDYIAETYASASGRTFSFYLTINTTAADAQLTLETSNNNVSYEVDEVSFRRLAAHVKNTNAYEVLAYQNPTGSSASQSCPGGAQCFAYVDGLNATIGWPLTIPAYSTIFVLWNNSPNLITPPTCTLNLSAGSVPTGQPVTVDWVSTGSIDSELNYSTYTGGVIESVGATGSRTFIPPYDAVTTISLNLVNDIGPNTCSVQVTTTNTAPNIYPVSFTGTEDAVQIDGTLSGEDLNPGDTVFFEKFTDPSNGIINVDSSGSVQYFPFADFCGNDSFLFRASDQWGHYADPIQQDINVACVNDAPVIVDDSGNTNGPMVSIDVLANDTDIDNIYEAQTFSIVSFTQPLSGSVVQNGNNLEYTPTGSFSGADIFTYRIQDQSGALSTNTGIVTINVVLPNMAPNAYNMNLTINEDTVLSDVLSGSDINGDILSFTALTLPSSGALNLLSNGTFSYTPDANIYGTDTFDFIANDGFMDSNTGTVSITITSVNDAPVGVDDAYTLNQDTSISIPVMNNDYDVDSLSYFLTGVTVPPNGIASISGTEIYYSPNSGYFGTDSFTYMIEDDGGLLSNIVTVNLNITFTNAAPIANSTSFSTNEDTNLLNFVTGTDPEMSTLTYFVDSTTTNGVLTLSSTGGFQYIPNADYFGSDSFTFHVSDGVLTSTSATVDITVNSVNDLPTANTTSFTTIGNSIVSSGFTYTGMLTGSDPEGSPLTFTAGTLPTHGTLSMTSTGYIVYTPAMNYIGTDNFTFRVNDGSANSSFATVNINITSNGAPIPLGSFTVITPASAYSGTAFGVTIQARDLIGNIMTGYTGSIVFTSNDPQAVLPSSGASITFNPGDAGVKTLPSSIVLYSLGAVRVSVEDTVMGATGSSNVSVSIAQTTPQAGPGGIPVFTGPTTTGSSSGQMESNMIYSSAPQGHTPQVFVFVGEGSELLNKLMLVNNVVNQDGTLGNHNGNTAHGNETNTPSGYYSSIPSSSLITYFMSLTGSDFMENSSTLQLRIAFWDHIHRAIESDNPESMFESAQKQLEDLFIEENERLSLVRDVLLRILESYQKKYRDIVDRGINLNSASKSDESTQEGDEENVDLSNLFEDEIDNTDLTNLGLTDEEIALLQE